MRTKITLLAAASAPLILSAAGAFASEPAFQIPTTDRAELTLPLLSQAAQAIKARTPRTAEDRISNLWLFPTGDEHTVFAQYIVTTKKISSGAEVSEQHLEVLKMENDRIVEQRDLIHSAGGSTLSTEQSRGARDWSASIGNGHTTSTTQTAATSTGSPASPHWSALIGSGQVRDGSTQSLQAASNVTGSQAPRAHWTSKIGTAHAVDSNTTTQTGKSPS
jgi:hypothetical protein